MPVEQNYWFPAKRYGWGWSLPNVWQGWIVMAIFVCLLLGGAVVLLPGRGPGAFVAYSALLCVLLVAVCWVKGECPGWRSSGLAYGKPLMSNVRAHTMADIRTHYLDASAIVKILVNEDGSQVLREYIGRHAVFSTTSVCFTEALSVLKRKYLKKCLTQEEYLSACEELMAHLRGRTLVIDDVGISTREVFDEVERLAKEYNLDVSDSLQLVTLKRGSFSSFGGDSTPILVTADKDLALAATAEGLRAWNCLRDPAPS